MARVQVILEDEERELFRRQAAVEGLSLSAWLRAAAQESFSRKRRRGGIESVDDLREFFRMCDERAGEEGREPEWEDHLQVIERSKGAGSSQT